MSHKKWMLILAALILAMAGIWLFLTHRSGEARVVVISSESKVLRTIDLDTAEDEEFVIFDSKGGKNTVCIGNGEIWIDQADCPDGICVDHGPLKKSGTPIVCLPHQLVIRWASDTTEVDN